MLLKLQAVFPKDINEHTYGAYYEALKDWKMEYVEKAGMWLMRNARFFPLPVDFLSRLFDETGGLESITSTMKENIPQITEDSRVTDITSKIGRSKEP